jgi:hypothetical protein
MNSIVNRIDLALSAQLLLRARHLPLSENLIFRDSTVLDMLLSFVFNSTVFLVFTFGFLLVLDLLHRLFDCAFANELLFVSGQR